MCGGVRTTMLDHHLLPWQWRGLPAQGLEPGSARRERQRRRFLALFVSAQNGRIKACKLPE
jgi:5-hydroxyisourate hydrolase-like protein (transthyretin family)